MCIRDSYQTVHEAPEFSPALFRNLIDLRARKRLHQNPRRHIGDHCNRSYRQVAVRRCDHFKYLSLIHI